MLRFSKGNSKLGKHVLIFNLPAGKTCPGAKQCLAFAQLMDNGKRKVVDGPQMEFRCFAAQAEAQYTAVYNSRQANWDAIRLAISAGGPAQAADLLEQGIEANRTKHTRWVRIHESGDFFTMAYLEAWLEVARRNPDLKFYCYTKNLPLFLSVGLDTLPANFYVTASYGGQFDHLIGLFPRVAYVFKTEQEAADRGLEVDHDDSHCFGPYSFALLVHGSQKAGSEWSKAITERRKRKQFAGYNRK